jgi:hypothetical protein
VRQIKLARRDKLVPKLKQIVDRSLIRNSHSSGSLRGHEVERP